MGGLAPQDAQPNIPLRAHREELALVPGLDDTGEHLMFPGVDESVSSSSSWKCQLAHHFLRTPSPISILVGSRHGLSCSALKFSMCGTLTAHVSTCL